jgi:alkylhydroperoxidase/carboxymuconolactone decarboxylase family protein YurZ
VKKASDGGSDMLNKIVTELLKDSNKKRLIEVLRNLNSKHEYAQIAHALLAEILPRFNSEEYLETPEYKGASQKELKEALKVLTFYSEKHIDRAERGLKKSYFPDYVLS